MEAENEDINALENFPQELFQNNQDYLSIMIFLKDLINNNGNIKEDFNDDSQLKKTLCDQVFAIFLYRIAKHITPECFKELCVFICIFRKTFNLKGWEVKKSQQVKNNETVISVFHENILPFCENNTAEFALEISNDFIIDYFPKYLKEIKCDQFKVIGEEEEKLKNVVYLTQHFCNWLFNNYYTNSRLSLNLN